MTRSRFEGAIAGVGSASGVRIVVGMWQHTPFGEFTDAMIETADGHRILIASRPEIAEFISSTYAFDETRIEATALITGASTRTFRAESLQLSFTVGRRTPVGWALSAVPRPLARTAAWSRAIGPAARLIRPGVRTAGTAGGGRREYYCATDEHAITAVDGEFDGRALGELRTVEPVVRFGFASTPKRPAIVAVTTIVDQP